MEQEIFDRSYMILIIANDFNFEGKVSIYLYTYFGSLFHIQIQQILANQLYFNNADENTILST